MKDKFNQIDIFWQEDNIMSIKKINSMFYSIINIENIQKAKENGFLVSIISKTQLVSDKLPMFIGDRIPKGTVNPLDYLKETGCRFETDKMSIKVS